MSSINDSFSPSQIIYQDNHLIIVNKKPAQIVQGDKTGDLALNESLKLYVKEKYNKPGDVFLGVPHRIDRPTSGIVLFTRTSKALSRLSEMFKNGEIEKVYYALVEKLPESPRGTLEHFLIKNAKQNKSYVAGEKRKGAKFSKLHFQHIASSKRYHLLKIQLETGRHHQIRVQLAHIGSPIVGDLKYGAGRSLKGGGIMLHAGNIKFLHPVKKETLEIKAPFPDQDLWRFFKEHF